MPAPAVSGPPGRNPNSPALNPPAAHRRGISASSAFRTRPAGGIVGDGTCSSRSRSSGRVRADRRSCIPLIRARTAPQTCSTASSDAITAAILWRPDRQRPLSGAVALRAGFCRQAWGSFDALVLLAAACLARRQDVVLKRKPGGAIDLLVREIPSSSSGSAGGRMRLRPSSHPRAMIGPDVMHAQQRRMRTLPAATIPSAVSQSRSVTAFIWSRAPGNERLRNPLDGCYAVVVHLPRLNGHGKSSSLSL